MGAGTEQTRNSERQGTQIAYGGLAKFIRQLKGENREISVDGPDNFFMHESRNVPKILEIEGFPLPCHIYSLLFYGWETRSRTQFQVFLAEKKL